MPPGLYPPTSTAVLALFTPSERKLLFPSETAPSADDWGWVDPDVLEPETWKALLETARPRVVVTGWSSLPLPEGATRAEGGPIEYVCNATGTIRHVVTRDQIANGLKVTNWGTFIGPLVAEHALLLTLACLRNLPSWPRSGDPEPAWAVGSYQTQALRGKRVGIYGFGAIARAILELLRPFEADIRVFSPGVDEAFILGHGVAPLPSLGALFDHAEVAIACESLTSRTRGAIDLDMLRRLPVGATFVNVGRGALVVEEALEAAIEERELRVGLDVFVKEPLPASSPLWRLPGAIVSPHIGGPTDDASAQCGRWAMQNVERFLHGKDPVGLISTEVFDRAT